MKVGSPRPLPSVHEILLTRILCLRAWYIYSASFDFKPWLTLKARNAEEVEYAHRNGLKAGIVTSQETLGYRNGSWTLGKAYDFGLRFSNLPITITIW